MDISRISVRTKLLMLAIGALTGILITEIMLRCIGFVYSYSEFYEADPIIGTRLRAHSAGWWVSEGRQYVRISSQGLRDHEHHVAKPASALRIAVLGDSFAEAFQVAVDDTFWSVMADRLERCDHLGYQSVEVINFGVSGYGTAQELLTLRFRVWDYSPDIVVLAMFTGNDLRNNSSDLATDKLRPFFYLVNDELRIDNRFLENQVYQQRLGFESDPVKRGRRFLRVHSHTYQMLARLKSRQFGDTRPEPTVDDGPYEPGLDDWIYLPPTTEEHHRAWQLTARLVEEILREVTEHGSRLLLVTLSNPIQVEIDPLQRAAFLDSLSPDADLFYPDKRIRALAHELGIEAVTLAPSLFRFAVEHQVYLHGFEQTGLGHGHWNEAGHRQAGAMIAEYLCHESKLLRDPTDPK